jgi:hypothetical protein
MRRRQRERQQQQKRAVASTPEKVLGYVRATDIPTSPSAREQQEVPLPANPLEFMKLTNESQGGRHSARKEDQDEERRKPCRLVTWHEGEEFRWTGETRLLKYAEMGFPTGRGRGEAKLC